MELQTTWFYLWGLLWAVFFMTDGFDFGIGTLYPFLGKSDEDRRVMINTLGPLWDGNEVWLVAAGGITFAAFPRLYAIMFSSLYTPLMLILFALIIRGVSFEFRSKLKSSVWRGTWDTAIFIGSVVPAVLFGVVFANIFQGLPINENGVLQGGFLTLFNPYGLLGGLLFLLLFMQHGALWLCIRTTGELQRRAEITVRRVWNVLLITAVGFLAYSAVTTGLYDNYLAQPAFFVIIAITVAALTGVRLLLVKNAYFTAWISSAVTISGVAFYGLAGLFPTVFPSSIDPAYSLTVQNASSSPLTLKIMLGVMVVLVPVIIAYQSWAYSLFKDKVTVDDLEYENAY
jgi:cytochrome d ubiquinol oxidase subunit II